MESTAQSIIYSGPRSEYIHPPNEWGQRTWKAAEIERKRGFKGYSNYCFITNLEGSRNLILSKKKLGWESVKRNRRSLLKKLITASFQLQIPIFVSRGLPPKETEKQCKAVARNLNAFSGTQCLPMPMKQRDKYFHTLSDSRVKQPLPEFTTEGCQNLQLVKLCLSYFLITWVQAADRVCTFFFFSPPLSPPSTVSVLPS